MASGQWSEKPTGHRPLIADHWRLWKVVRCCLVIVALVARSLFPENTVASFDLALASGCDGFEFDVRLTADGHAVVCHHERIGGLEIACSSAQQLGLPLLREILTRYQRSAFLDIELKVPGLETITADLLREFTPARGFVVSSFLPKC